MGGALMNEEEQMRSKCVLWIDRVDRIIVFKETDGFEAKTFSSQDEMIAYAFRKVSSAYRIQ